MNFFCTKEHYQLWTKKMGLTASDDIFCLDAQEALAVAGMLFKELD